MSPKQTEVVCGVCGNPHAVEARSGQYKCTAGGAPYQLIFGTVRSKSERGSSRGNQRHIKLRARHAEEERLYEWTWRYGDQVEARSGDHFALAIADDEITGFHNLTVQRHWFYRRPVGSYLPAIVIVSVVALGAAAAIIGADAVQSRTDSPCGSGPVPEGAVSSLWTDYQCMGKSNAGAIRWPACLARAAYAKTGEGCPAEERCCPRAEPPKYVCGSAFARLPGKIEAVDWGRHRCMTRQEAGTSRWSSCLSASRYARRGQKGCAGSKRCCPPATEAKPR